MLSIQNTTHFQQLSPHSKTNKRNDNSNKDITYNSRISKTLRKAQSKFNFRYVCQRLAGTCPMSAAANVVSSRGQWGGGGVRGGVEQGVRSTY